MPTVAMISEKGGCGKTSVATLLAAASTLDGVPAAIIDLDPQATACRWADRRRQDWPIVEDAAPARLDRALARVRGTGAKLVVIDTPGRAADTMMAAAKVCDLPIITLQPYPYDLETCPKTLELLRLAHAPVPLVVLTRVRQIGTRHQEATDYLKGLGIEVCPAMIGERFAYPDASMAGQTPLDSDPLSPAGLESKRVYEFVRELLNCRNALIEETAK